MFNQGYFVFKKLLKRKNLFHPIALVQSMKEAKSLQLEYPNINQDQICHINYHHYRKKGNKNENFPVFENVHKVVLCSSAKVKEKLFFQIKKLLFLLFGKTISATSKDLYYERNKRPFEIDYLFQKWIIDESLRQGSIEQIVQIGSMGGYRGSKLNEIGRDRSHQDIRSGNVLKWRRALERYLMKRTLFTIIHAGQLTDEKGGMREIVWDTDDSLLRTGFRKIPREDVAEVITT